MSEKARIRDKVVVSSPDAEIRRQVVSSLSGAIGDVEFVEAPTCEEAWGRILAGDVTLAICSGNSHDLSSLDLIHRIDIQRLSTKVIVISQPAPAHRVVELLKAGAKDFIEVPFAPDQIVSSAREVLEKVRMERIEIVAPTPTDGTRELIGNSPTIRSIRDLVDQVAPTNSTILITGESGTGKEVVARSIHRRSKRKDMPFGVVDCGTIPSGLVESELFGYVSGAFTGASGDKRGLLEQANNGTAFLDEVGEFPLDLQVKLLRVLQDGEIRRVGSDRVTKLNLRVIAATNKELDREARLGRFRQDLYYRINVVNVTMPPLRDRSEDIEAFVHFFLRKYLGEYDHSIQGITRGAMSMLRNYEWPGNIRELENTILQIMALHTNKPVIEERDLPMFLERRDQERQRRFLQDALDLKLSLEDYAREFVWMFEPEYTEKDLAAALGVTTKTLWQKRRKWDLPRRKNLAVG
jgi:two-component system response regulator AtoC